MVVLKYARICFILIKESSVLRDKNIDTGYLFFNCSE